MPSRRHNCRSGRVPTAGNVEAVVLQNYFDNAATTPLDPKVLEAMQPYLGGAFGNANSIHAWGRAAGDAVETARAQVAAAIGADDPAQIVFTSGATEGNNWVLSNFDDGAVSPFEHSSVWETARVKNLAVLENRGFELIPPTRQLTFISVMAVNNETGARLKPESLRAHAAVLHSDITQAAAKYPVALEQLDYATFSAHKFYGPKGVGALYMREAPLLPFMHGGEHERGWRAGTLNVAGIVGMGAAAAMAAERADQDGDLVTRLGEAVLDRLGDVSDWQVNGGELRAPHILSLSFAGIHGEALVIELDAAGFGISSGAACSSHSTAPSHVLTALGVPDAFVRGTVRISFGRFNTVDSAAGLGAALRNAVAQLRRHN